MKKLKIDQLQISSFVTEQQQVFIKGQGVGGNDTHNSNCVTYDEDPEIC